MNDIYEFTDSQTNSNSYSIYTRPDTQLNILSQTTTTASLSLTIVAIKEITAAILFVSTATPTVTPSNFPRILKPFLIRLGTGIGLVVICIATFVF
ncbi:hypothetical protein Glove_168g41 [Diversispora epigaea]|uniref:Uncharacterized protein n=1 Tax=Diversispora epigaea TaxID=1348612 RepID=A0A397IPI6_9GLOM|nr:hypothetical protein Glove_168g41 [Diversispora epigaea]